jgi:hypothetical protein
MERAEMKKYKGKAVNRGNTQKTGNPKTGRKSIK